MLGTHLICDLSGNPPLRASLHHEMAQCVSDADINRLVWKTADSSLYVSLYPGYPSRVIEDAQFSIHLEGFLYNVDETALAKELTYFAEIVFAQGERMQDRLSRRMLNTDGDFLIVLRNKKSGATAVINDILGRLPTYYTIDQGALILSRDFSLIARLSGKSRFDRMAVGQYLLLGFCPGERTWFEGINTLQPASLIMTKPGVSSPQVTQICELDLDCQEHAARRSKENARQLAERFREACRNRVRWGGRPIVSLSGGLDSRAVAAGLWKEKIPFSAGSFLDQQKSNETDFHTAREIAALLDAEWCGFRLPAPLGHDLIQLLALKHGFNSLRMSSILPFFGQLRESFGANLLYLTGDGGGDALGDSAPYRRTPNLDSLISYLIERYQIFSPQDVAALTGLRADDIAAEIGNLLAAYPETSMPGKYKHFFSIEVAVKMYHEGEDRNRRYFWSATPFYALDFFTYAMNCSDAGKKGYRLYGEFLAELHPDIFQIRYANWNASVSSSQFKLLYGAKNLTRIWPAAIRRLRRLTGRYDTVPHDSNLLNCLREQSEKSPGLRDIIDHSALQKLLRNPKACDRIQLWTLLTFTSVVDDWTNPRPVLTAYLDREFR